MKEYKNTLSAAIAEYVQQRASTKLEVLDKIQEKELQKLQANSSDYLALQAEQKQKRLQEEAKFSPAQWLESAANRARQISIVTHAPKYTHSDAKGSGMLVTSNPANLESSPCYLASEYLPHLQTDVVGNAAALDIAGLLKLQTDEVVLYEEIARDNIEPLLPFAESPKQAKEWLHGFKQALQPGELASHALAKQLYFPLAEGGYHLISPLFASSLYQQVHEKIEYALYSEEQQAARDAKKKGNPSDIATIGYADMAVQNFGGTKPQNISQLNTKRYGKAYLLNCAPPKWEKQLQLPLNSAYAFWNIYSDRAWRKAQFLRQYLVSKQKRTSTMEIRDFRAELVDELIDLLIATAAEIQNAEAGWSVESKIPEAEKLWLDPDRTDEEFQQKRDDNDWQKEIAIGFGRWLNKRLRLSKKLNVDDAEFNEWRRISERKLNQLKMDLEEFA